MTGLNSLTKSSTQRVKRRVGRGGKRGKTSGRGHKGQRQHGGHGVRPELRDMIKKLPKLRGHGINRARTVNSSREACVPVNLDTLDKVFKDGESVTPSELAIRKVISKKSGVLPKVKILARGKIEKKLTIKDCIISENAKKLLESAGGKIVV